MIDAQSKSAAQAMRAATPQERAKMDLKFHFSKSTLMQMVCNLAPPPPPHVTRRAFQIQAVIQSALSAGPEVCIDGFHAFEAC